MTLVVHQFPSCLDEPFGVIQLQPKQGLQLTEAHQTGAAVLLENKMQQTEHKLQDQEEPSQAGLQTGHPLEVVPSRSAEAPCPWELPQMDLQVEHPQMDRVVAEEHRMGQRVARRLRKDQTLEVRLQKDRLVAVEPRNLAVVVLHAHHIHPEPMLVGRVGILLAVGNLQDH